MTVAVTVNGTSYTAPSKGDTGYAATFSSLVQALCAAAATVFQFNAASGLTTAARYLAPGMIAASTTEYLVKVPIAGKLSKLYVVGTSAASGDSVVFVVQVDAVASTLTCTVANGASTANDVTHTVAVTAGQTVSVKATGGASYASGLANVSATFLFTPS